MTGTGNGGRTTRTPYRPLEWTDEMVERFWTWQAQYPETYFAFQFGDRRERDGQQREQQAGAQPGLGDGGGGVFSTGHGGRMEQSGL